MRGFLRFGPRSGGAPGARSSATGTVVRSSPSTSPCAPRGNASSWRTTGSSRGTASLCSSGEPLGQALQRRPRWGYPVRRKQLLAVHAHVVDRVAVRHVVRKRLCRALGLGKEAPVEPPVHWDSSAEGCSATPSTDESHHKFPHVLRKPATSRRSSPPVALSPAWNGLAGGQCRRREVERYTFSFEVDPDPAWIPTNVTRCRQRSRAIAAGWSRSSMRRTSGVANGARVLRRHLTVPAQDTLLPGERDVIKVIVECDLDREREQVAPAQDGSLGTLAPSRRSRRSGTSTSAA
jgi:hypothetical protein